MALMYLFHRLEIDGLAVHVNYNRRGRESDMDAELVEQMAFEWGFDCHSLSVDPDEAAGRNFQQWARSVRYDACRALAAEHSADGIVMGHHEDDQVETILQKLFRGAGLASWGGMEEWDRTVWRPFLGFTGQEIMDYIDGHAIPYRTDRSNLQSDYARNFLRNEWIPELEKHFPGWRENVLRMSGQAETFGYALQWIHGRLTDNRGRIERDGLLELEPSLVRSLVLYHLHTVEPGAQVSGDTLRELEKLGSLQTGKYLQLTDQLDIVRDRDHFVITGEEPGVLPPVKVGMDALESGRVTIHGFHLELEPYDDPDFGNGLWLDADAVQWPLTLRPWREGDRFRPLGMKGHQKVSDHLTNRKVNTDARGEALVVTGAEGMIAAVLFPEREHRNPPGTVSEEAKCNGSTELCLTINTSG